jgi:hypothetical protein
MSQQKNEMMDFMWSAFRKVAGINNKKVTEDENDVNALVDSMNKTSDAPLAKFDGDDL